MYTVIREPLLPCTSRHNPIIRTIHIHNHGTPSYVQLSARAIKDYNRGRAYLASVANKNRVPIYTNIPDAVHRAMHLARGHYLPRSPSGTSV